MSEGKPSHVSWENFTREELLAELTRLQAENTRLTALIPAALTARDKFVQMTRIGLLQQSEAWVARYFRPSTRYRFSGVFFAVVRMSIRFAGRAGTLGSPVTHRPAPMNGEQAFATSLASAARTVGIACCCHLTIRSSTRIWPAIIRWASIH